MNILHPEDAKLLPGPPDMPECAALPVVMTADAMTSFWQPDVYELEALQRGGSISLGILGRTHPVVRMGVHEFPGTLATEPHDEALDRAARVADQWQENPVQEAFKAGARWQSARPTELKMTELLWQMDNETPDLTIHYAQDKPTGRLYRFAVHEGVIIDHNHQPFDGNVEGMKAKLQIERNALLLEGLFVGVISG